MCERERERERERKRERERDARTHSILMSLYIMLTRALNIDDGGWLQRLAEESTGGGGVVVFTSPSRAHKAIACASDESRDRWGACNLTAVKGGDFLRGIIDGGGSPVVVFDV